MAYTLPYVFANESGTQPSTQLDANFNALLTGVNNTFLSGTLASRPAFGTSGAFYFATDQGGGTLYFDTGTSWLQVGASVNPALAALRGSTGHRSTNNAANPTTQMDLVAETVLLVDNSGSPVIVQAPGTLTCNTGTAGPTPNGRDQAAAFVASSWLHFYWIYNPSTKTIASLVSLTAPPTGPILPSGYTAWAYAGPVYFNASSQLLLMQAAAAWWYYATPPLVYSWSGSLVETAISVSTAVPPNARSFCLGGHAVELANANESFVLRYLSGQDFVIVSFGNAPGYAQIETIMPNVAQKFYLSNPNGPDIVGDIYTHGYQVSNGAS